MVNIGNFILKEVAFVLDVLLLTLSLLSADWAVELLDDFLFAVEINSTCFHKYRYLL